MKGKKDILEAFLYNLGNSFFEKKKIYSIQKFLGIESTGGRNSEVLLYFPAFILHDCFMLS